jgi:amidase
MGTELWARGAGELAAMIKGREVTSSEVVEAHLGRIAEVNPHLNAVVRVLAEEARAGAAAADDAIAAGSETGPLHGVPFTIKENVDVAGTPTTNGLPIFADAISPIDAPLVARMRAAGGIPIGRTNLPDLGLRLHTDSALHGLTKNPWNPHLTTGGSSGGEASALASGMSPLGVGNDLGGSLRNPAHCCGVASIKPTTGRVPFGTMIPPEDLNAVFQLMVTDGPMARTVADVRLGLEVMSGAHPRDPRSVDAAWHRETTGCRVALLADVPGGETDPGIAASVRRAADYLSDAGYDVVEATPPSYERSIELWSSLLMVEIDAQRDLLNMVMGEGGRTFLDFGQQITPASDLKTYLAEHSERYAVAMQWATWMEEHPLVLSPTWAIPAFPHGFDIESLENAQRVFETIRPILPGNLLGLPCAVVPGDQADGMPVGVQIIGRRFHEMGCLDAAQVIETAVGPVTPIDPVLV